MRVTEALEAHLDLYGRRMARRGWGDLARRQDGRLASLSHGAAGVAYALSHLAARRGDRGLLEAAERWSREAWARRGEPLAFFPAGALPRRRMAAGAFVYGEVGVVFVRALIAAARGDSATLDGALDRFIAACRRPPAADELYAGGAGMLLAAAHLLRATGDGRLTAPGEELAARLARRTRALSGGRIPWRRGAGPGLAHGAGGVLSALLAWSAAAGTAPPPGLAAAVDRLVGGALDDPERFCSRPSFVASLCNGFAGLAVLAAAAAAAFGGAARVEAARGAAARALAAVPPRPDLCCGRAGVAAACLALAVVDPGGDWRRRAGELLLSTLLCGEDGWEAAGLLGGEAATVCLAADLVAGAASGPPALAWVPAPTTAAGRAA